MTAEPGRVFAALVVDDEEAVRRFVGRAFREAGYETATASGGAFLEKPCTLRGLLEAASLLLAGSIHIPEHFA